MSVVKLLRENKQRIDAINNFQPLTIKHIVKDLG